MAVDKRGRKLLKEIPYQCTTTDKGMSNPTTFMYIGLMLLYIISG